MAACGGDEAAAETMGDALERASARLLRAAAAAAKRRGSAVIREEDVLEAVHAEGVRKERRVVWYRLPVRGDGACLFTSLRLSLELLFVVSRIDAGAAPSAYVLDGKSDAMCGAALSLRGSIIEWYRSYLRREVPQLGEYVAGGRSWQRGDLLALEMVRKGIQVPEEGGSREAEMLKYLLNMSRPTAWGSTPEYTALAFLTGKTVRVYQRAAATPLLQLINSVNERVEAPPGCARASARPPLPQT